MRLFLLAVGAALALSGCTVLHVAGNVAEGAVKTTGSVIGAGADAVTTSDEEKAAEAHKDD
jgi:hypothetical protein